MLRFLFAWPTALGRYRKAIAEACDQLAADLESRTDGRWIPDYVVLHDDGVISHETYWTLGRNDHGYSYAETNDARILVVHDANDPCPHMAILALAVASALYLDPAWGAFDILRRRFHILRLRFRRLIAARK